MQKAHRTRIMSALIVLFASSLRGQVAPDLSGHWEGSVEAPGMQIEFQIDLAKTAAGDFGGAISIPSQNLRGLPLQKVSIKDNIVGFWARRDQTMTGYLSADGKSISGDYTIEGFAIPFTLNRTGDARLEPPVKSSPIGKELEGTWNGSIQADGGTLRVTLTMANQPDGSALGRFVVIDQGGLELPVEITQDASRVTLDSRAVSGRFAGTLNALNTELTGTWTQGSMALPLTLRRASDGEK